MLFRRHFCEHAQTPGGSHLISSLLSRLDVLEFVKFLEFCFAIP
jgi:hypothetical protein